MGHGHGLQNLSEYILGTDTLLFAYEIRFSKLTAEQILKENVFSYLLENGKLS
jgi:hypothetical protein